MEEEMLDGFKGFSAKDAPSRAMEGSLRKVLTFRSFVAKYSLHEKSGARRGFQFL